MYNQLVNAFIDAQTAAWRSYYALAQTEDRALGAIDPGRRAKLLAKGLGNEGVIALTIDDAGCWSNTVPSASVPASARRYTRYTRALRRSISICGTAVSRHSGIVRHRRGGRACPIFLTPTGASRRGAPVQGAIMLDEILQKLEAAIAVLASLIREGHPLCGTLSRKDSTCATILMLKAVRRVAIQGSAQPAHYYLHGRYDHRK
jgi:hypothetical protein